MVCFAFKISIFVLTCLFFYYTVYPLLRLASYKKLYYITGKMGQRVSVAREKTDDMFSVLSWNIWFGSRDGWDQPRKRWSHLLQITIEKNPDLIGFQECTSAFLNTVENTSAFKDKYVAANEMPKGYSYLVMIYVRKSLLVKHSKTILLKTNLGRRCESVDVKKAGRLFRFATVHIESYVTSENVREIQMKTIFDSLMKSSSSIELAFVVGDFNFDETGKENTVIERSAFVDAWPAVHPLEKGYTFENQVNLMNKHALKVGEGIKALRQERLDRILFWDPRKTDWKAVQCEILGTSHFDEIYVDGKESVKLFSSDHFGLFATFEKVK